MDMRGRPSLALSPHLFTTHPQMQTFLPKVLPLNHLLGSGEEGVRSFLRVSATKRTDSDITQVNSCNKHWLCCGAPSLPSGLFSCSARAAYYWHYFEELMRLCLQLKLSSLADSTCLFMQNIFKSITFVKS